MVHFTIAPPVMSFGNVTLAGGVRLQYAHQGPPSGPPIIFLHGYSDSSLSFSRVMPLLPAHLRVIAPDLRGHGNSDRPAGGYQITEMAGDVIQLMDALQVSSAVIVGHSMGSFIAQAIAARAPERVAGLVLLGSAARADNRAVQDLRKEVDLQADPVDAAFVRAFQYSTVAQPVPETFMNAAIANSRRMPAPVWKAIIKGLIDYRPISPRPHVRTLVLGGNLDAVFSVAEQTQLAGEYPGARLRTIDGIGHTLHWEDPERFVQELLDFIASKL